VFAALRAGLGFVRRS